MGASNTKENIDTARYDQETSSAAEESEMTTAQRSSAHSEEKKEMTLYPLLMDDSLLPRILEELVDDGLHECRRVCRKWRDVCNALPVKLDVCDRQHIVKASQTFPKASSLVCWPYISNSSVSDHQERTQRSEEQLLPSIARMTNLRSLETTTVGADWWTIPGNASPFAFLTGLQSVDLDGGSDTSHDLLFEAVRVLIGLTSLRLVSGVPAPSPEAEPLTEIRNLKRLELSDQLFCDREGRFLFPALSQLTHLGHCALVPIEGKNLLTPGILEKILPACETTLRSLKICDRYRRISPDGWSVLLQFPNLEVLAFDRIRDEEGVVLDVIKHMTYLRKLETACIQAPRNKMSHLLSSLGGLESLCCSQPILLGTDDVDISHMTLFTSLRMNYGKLQIPFRNLTGLVALDLHLYTGTDLCESLWRMPLLETVRVTGLEEPCFEDTSVFRNLRRLRSLTLDTLVDVGGDFFPALGSLPELTFLKFFCKQAPDSASSLRQISLVRSLKALDCRRLLEVEPLDYLLDGCLPRLRWLAIPSASDSSERARELRRRLPCLNRISGA